MGDIFEKNIILYGYSSVKNSVHLLNGQFKSACLHQFIKKGTILPTSHAPKKRKCSIFLKVNKY